MFHKTSKENWKITEVFEKSKVLVPVCFPIVIIKQQLRNSLWRKGFVSGCRLLSITERSGVGTKVRNLEAGTGAHATEELCLLVSST